MVIEPSLTYSYVQDPLRKVSSLGNDNYNDGQVSKSKAILRSIQTSDKTVVACLSVVEI